MQHMGCNGGFTFDIPQKRANSCFMPEPVEVTSRTNWLLIAAIFVAGLFGAAQFGKLTLTLEVMQNAYPNARDWVPSLVSVVGVVGLFFGVVAGPVIARIGMARVLVISMMIGAGMSLIQATLPPMSIFALSRIVEGFSHLGLVITGPTIIAMVSTDRDRPLAMGIWAAFFGASLAITAFFLPKILNSGGLPLLFGLHGGGMIAITGCLMVMLPKTPRDIATPPSFFQAYRTLYTTSNLLLPGAGFVWYTGLYIALIAVLPLAIPLTPAQIAAIPLVSIAGTLGAGVIARIVAPHHLSTAGFVASTVLMFAIWAGFTQILVIYALFLLMGAIPTGAFAAISHFNKSTTTRAQATGGLTHFGNIGTTLGTPLMVLAFQFAGLTGITVMVLACCIGGIITIAALTRTNT
jgi:MFS family permease